MGIAFFPPVDAESAAQPTGVGSDSADSESDSDVAAQAMKKKNKKEKVGFRERKVCDWCAIITEF